MNICNTRIASEFGFMEENRRYASDVIVKDTDRPRYGGNVNAIFKVEYLRDYTGCESCVLGVTFSDSENNQECQPVRTCGPGYGVTGTATAS